MAEVMCHSRSVARKHYATNTDDILLKYLDILNKISECTPAPQREEPEKYQDEQIESYLDDTDADDGNYNDDINAAQNDQIPSKDNTVAIVDTPSKDNTVAIVDTCQDDTSAENITITNRSPGPVQNEHMTRYLNDCCRLVDPTGQESEAADPIGPITAELTVCLCYFTIVSLIYFSIMSCTI